MNKKVLRRRVRMFIFKISIGRRTFLRNRKKTAILNKKTKIRTTIEIVKKSRARKLRSLLSWQKHTIRTLATDICGEGGFSGGRNIPRNPPGTRNIGDKSVISRISRERRLGPPETVYVKGLCKLTV